MSRKLANHHCRALRLQVPHSLRCAPRVQAAVGRRTAVDKMPAPRFRNSPNACLRSIMSRSEWSTPHRTAAQETPARTGRYWPYTQRPPINCLAGFVASSMQRRMADTGKVCCTSIRPLYKYPLVGAARARAGWGATQRRENAPPQTTPAHTRTHRVASVLRITARAARCYRWLYR
jgi:hypothetical protein